MLDTEQVDSIFRLVDREIWIVTATNGSRRGGLVATWVSRASLDPQSPVVAVAIAPHHLTAELIDGSGAFAAHLIGEEHIELVWNFAIGSGLQRDKLANLDLMTAETGSPVLRDCIAWLDCRVFARLDGGDRTYYWADVVASGIPAPGVPLTERRVIELANDQQRSALQADLRADVALQRPLRDSWRRQLPDFLRPS